MRCKLFLLKSIILLICFQAITYQSLRGQVLHKSFDYNSSRSPKLLTSFKNYFTYQKNSNKWYFSSSIEAAYASNNFELGLNAQINKKQHFKFLSHKYVFRINGEDVSISENTRFNPNPVEYEINIPLSLYSKIDVGDFRIFTPLSLLTQQTRSETPIPVVLDSLFFVNWNTNQFENTILLGSAIIQYTFYEWSFGSGITNLPILTAGDRGFDHEYIPKVNPVFSLGYRLNKSRFVSYYDKKSITFQYNQIFDQNISNTHKFKSYFSFRSGISDYKYNTIKVGMEFPVFENLLAQLEYTNTWSGTGVKNKKSFDQWQQSLVIDSHDFRLASLIPQHSLSVKLVLEFDLTNSIWPIKVTSLNLFHSQLYTAKSPFYNQHPIGTIEIENDWDEPINVTLNISTTTGTGKYQTPTTSIEANSSKEINLFINLTEKEEQKIVSHEQLVIAAEVKNESRIIANESIDIYNKNIWNGKVRDLEWFISSNDAELKKYSLQLYNEATYKNQNIDDKHIQKFNTLKYFFETAGKKFNYSTDPLFSVNRDFVQYPLETFEKKTGDCEDLVVYFISLLRYNGINSAVVDIQPFEEVNQFGLNGNTIMGHVFLLVDTSINISELERLELNEFQGISRSDKTGKKTIWLPLELTEIQNGFDRAFTKGVEIYYNEIINKNGHKDGKVNVYNF